MKAKRKFILGCFLFSLGILSFIFLVPEDGVLNVKINNEILSIALGLALFIFFAISGTILIANNERRIVENMDIYKVDTVMKTCLTVMLLIFLLVMLGISSYRRYETVTVVCFVLIICFVLILYYYSRKIHRFRTIERKYIDYEFKIESLFDKVACGHYQSYLVYELRNALNDSSYDINTDFKIKEELVQIIVKKEDIRLTVNFTNEGSWTEMTLPLVIYQGFNDNYQIPNDLGYTKDIISLLEFDDDLNIEYNEKEDDIVYEIKEIIKAKYKQALELKEFCLKVVMK